MNEGSIDAVRKHLILIDGPNVEGCQRTLLRERLPSRSERPDWEAFLAWAQAQDESLAVEACMFTNLPPKTPENEARRRKADAWGRNMARHGYRVYLKTKQLPGDDIDDEMMTHLWYRYTQEHVARVTLVSGDAQNVLEDLTMLATGRFERRNLPLNRKTGAVKQLVPPPEESVHVCSVAFREFAGALNDQSDFEFIDLREIPGIFHESMPAPVRIDNLPVEGYWIDPPSWVEPLSVEYAQVS